MYLLFVMVADKASVCLHNLVRSNGYAVSDSAGGMVNYFRSMGG